MRVSILQNRPPRPEQRLRPFMVFLAHGFWGLLRGGSRRASGRAQEVPKTSMDGLGCRGPPEPPGPGPKNNQKSILFAGRFEAAELVLGRRCASGAGRRPLPPEPPLASGRASVALVSAWVSPRWGALGTPLAAAGSRAHQVPGLPGPVLGRFGPQAQCARTKNRQIVRAEHPGRLRPAFGPSTSGLRAKIGPNRPRSSARGAGVQTLRGKSWYHPPRALAR